MTTHPVLVVVILLVSLPVPAFALSEKIFDDANKTSIDTHRETEGIIAPYLKKIEEAENRSEQQFKNDPDEDSDDEKLATGSAGGRAGRAQEQTSRQQARKSGGASFSTTQKRLLNTGEIGAAGGAEAVSFKGSGSAPSRGSSAAGAEDVTPGGAEAIEFGGKK